MSNYTHQTTPMLMGDRSSSEESKAVVDAYYQAGVQGRLPDFARYLHPDFTTTAPNYRGWGALFLALVGVAMGLYLMLA
jgi:hypothetical protein